MIMLGMFACLETGIWPDRSQFLLLAQQPRDCPSRRLIGTTGTAAHLCIQPKLPIERRRLWGGLHVAVQASCVGSTLRQ